MRKDPVEMKSTKFQFKLFAPVVALLSVMIPVHAGIIVPLTVDSSFDGQSLSAVDLSSLDALTGISTDSGDIEESDFSLQYSVTADSDPFLTYGFSVVNLTSAPLVVSEQFSTPVTGGPWDESTASLSISAVPGFDSFGLVAAGPNTVATATVTEANGSSENLGVGLGGNCQSLLHAGSCYAVAASSTFAGQDFSTLNVQVNFTLDGLGSAVTVNGRVDLLEAVADPDLAPGPSSTPEPGTLALAGLGFIFVLGKMRKRNQLAL